MHQKARAFAGGRIAGHHQLGCNIEMIAHPNYAGVGDLPAHARRELKLLPYVCPQFLFYAVIDIVKSAATIFQVAIGRSVDAIERDSQPVKRLHAGAEDTDITGDVSGLRPRCVAHF